MHSHHYKLWGALMAVVALASAGFMVVLIDEIKQRYRRARAWWGNAATGLVAMAVIPRRSRGTSRATSPSR